MRAMRYHGFGGPEQLRLEEVPVPEPGDDEVLVRVEYAGVNPVDTKILAGQFPAARPPRTLGIDFAGVVERGASLAPGSAVVGSGQGLGVVRDGAYAEFVVVPAACVVPRPAALTVERAAGLGVVFLTAWMALVEAAAARPGETVLVYGASGGVGQAALQIAARVAGARVIAVTSGGPGVARARSLGAHEVIDRTRDEVPAAVRRLTADRGADVILDVVGGAVFESSVALLAPYGRLVAIGVSAGERGRVELDLAEFYRANRRIAGVNSGALGPEARGRVLREIVERIARGELTAPDVDVLPLADAAGAHARLRSPEGAHGKMVLAI